MYKLRLRCIGGNSSPLAIGGLQPVGENGDFQPLHVKISR